MSTSLPGPGTGSADHTSTSGSHAPSATPDSHPSEGRSLGDIVGDIASDLSNLVRHELDLAKREAKAEASKAGKGAGMLGGAAVAALLMLIFVSLALTYLLDNVMPVELAALVVGLLWAVVTGFLAMAGKKQFQNVDPSLTNTQRSLKEDAQWVRTPTSS